jgi:alpha-1,3-rhamnosyltransferase
MLQDYSKIELLIIDDGSSDDSINVADSLRELCTKRFHRFEIRHRENKGLSATLNEGIDWSQGSYFSPFASDDVMLPSKISLLLRRIRTSPLKPAAVFGGTEMFDETGKTVGQSAYHHIHRFDDLLMHRRMPVAPAALIDTDKLKKTNGFLVGSPIEDWPLWLDLTKNGDVLETFPEMVARYRRHSGNMSKKYKVMHSSRLEILKQYQSHPCYGIAMYRALKISCADAISHGDHQFFWNIVKENKHNYSLKFPGQQIFNLFLSKLSVLGKK